MNKKIYRIAEIHGMCGGVYAALETLEKLLVSQKSEIFVFQELVHNCAVTASFEQRGVSFVRNIDEIPDGSTVVIGAHGVAAETENVLRRKAAICYDTTCPLVKKLHNIVSALSPADQLIICGKADHPEIAGVIGNSGTPQIFLISSPDEVDALPELSAPVFLSQTTVDHIAVEKSLEKLKKRFPALLDYSGICPASRERQQAVLRLAEKVDCMVVIGSDHSSNAKRLREIAERAGCRAFLIDNAGFLTAEILNHSRIGITGGASTPQHLFDEVIAALENDGFIRED